MSALPRALSLLATLSLACTPVAGPASSPKVASTPLPNTGPTVSNEGSPTMTSQMTPPKALPQIPTSDHPSQSGPYQASWNSLDARPIPTWFVDAKFGIFIHWGVYSVPSWAQVEGVRKGSAPSYAEWYYVYSMGERRPEGSTFHEDNYGKNFEYRKFGPMFKAELFNPTEWAKMFAESGAKYVVLTSKHHDGFSLWPTKVKSKKGWNSGDIGPKRDLVGELTNAVRNAGLKMGLYYSMIEWETNHTGRTESRRFIPEDMMKKYGMPEDKYVAEVVMPQLKELVTNYKPAVIFSDGGEWDQDENYWQTKEFLSWLYNEGPNVDEVVVNDRFSKGMPGKHGDYYSSEYEDTDAVGTAHAWEESRGMGGSYGFNRAEAIDDYETSKALIQELVDIVSRGGNLLLNVGPTADGRIPVIMQQRLRDIGAWLAVNGEAIYGTRPWVGSMGRDEAKKGDGTQTVYFTRKHNDLYVIFTEWPKGAVEVGGLSIREDSRVTLLGYNGAVDVQTSETSLKLSPPVMSPAEVPPSEAFVFKLANVL